MKKRLFVLGALGFCVSFAMGQAASFTALVKKYGLRTAASQKTLADATGTRMVMLQGTFRGFIQGADGATLPFQSSDGLFLTIRAAKAPDWIKQGATTAKVIVKINRSDTYSSWNAELMAAIAADLEAESVQKPATKPKAPEKTTSKPLSSRSIPTRTSSRGRPAPMSGSLRTEPKLTLVTRSMAWNEAADEALPIYVSYIRKENRRLSTAQAEEIARAILGFSLKYGVDARLIMAIVITESNFRPQTLSSAGAMGLGQLMPINAQELGIKNPYDLTENLWGTIKLVRGHLDKYSAKHSDPDTILTLSLAGYNAGDGAVRKYGGVPPYRETQNYVRKVSQLYKRLAGIRD